MIHRDVTADREVWDKLDQAIDRNRQLLTEDEEQAAYLRKWSEQHPDNSGCVAGASVLLLAVVSLAAIVAALGGVA